MKRTLAIVLALILALTSFALTSAEEAEPITVEVLMGEAALVPLTDDFTYYQKLEEKTGIHIHFVSVPSADYNTKKSTALSTADFPDIMLVAQSDLNTYASEGLFVNLSEHKDELENFFNVVEKYPDAKVTYIDGNAYAFPTIARWDKVRGSALIARKDIMDALGVEVESIKTWEDFKGLLTQVKETYPDMIPFIARKLSADTYYALGAYKGIIFDPQEGKWSFDPIKEGARAALEYLNGLYTEGLLDPDFSTCTSADWQQKMTSNRGFCYLDNVNFANTNLPALQAIVPEAEWVIIPMPENENGLARGLFTNPHQLTRLWVINAASDKIDACLELFNYMYTEEACTILNLGTEGVDFYYDENGQAHYTDEVIAAYSTDGAFVKTAMQAVCGNAAYETFVPYSDNLAYFAVVPAHQDAWYQSIANDPAFTYPVNTPPFNAEERETLNAISTNINTILDKMYSDLVLGLDSFDNFDSYVQQLIDAGAETMEDIYNDAQARIG